MSDNTVKITPDTIAEHGLNAEEYALILEIMGREPNYTELGIFSVMWSEHCSYKSSKKWLKTLPTEAPWVICGPGENAGIIDIGDGQAAVFKMESHNHPSYIEPYQGAATGVGGIMRDVFTMGARPIANLNALRFGSPDHAKTRHLVGGVVAGIGGYGNCMGIPTVGGECEFHSAYNGNILVNAMTVGLADTDKIFYSEASGIGKPVIYVGAKTGRDGIHGATMASTEFNADSEEKRPTVQVGDPFTEKLLLEACMELMATDAIVAIQDMGAAGLTSSSFEMASKGGMGVDLDLDNVPQREEGMTAYEMMLSESQERMLMVLEPGREDEARKIFEKWELDFAVVGKLTDTGHMVLRHKGEIVADLPIDPLAEASPEYDRPWVETEPAEYLATMLGEIAKSAPDDVLKAMMATPDLASKRWIWEQYDHMVMADTVARPGGDAALVRVHGTNKGLAITSDCTPRYCLADPVQGGRQAVAEAWRNITATGATPLACTDNLNFGNPEKPEIMGQLVGCIQGMGEACTSLDFPIVSGNVSLYNETEGNAILPTPVIGGVGLIDDISKAATLAFKNHGEFIVLIGDNFGHIGQSIYLSLATDVQKIYTPPALNLHRERRNGDFVREQILDGAVTACHDISDGGLLVAIAEMALAGNIGCKVEPNMVHECPLNDWLFGEDQARYIVTTSEEGAGTLIAAARNADVSALIIGETGGNAIVINQEMTQRGNISLDDLRDVHEGWLPSYMAG
ncbi:MAG: phosphoribosylformylglycinamidine synthase subunit PurL [Rhodospirillales bacterium]|jgi:phosphoribosylformylglycinamidine synthase subunit PurL|nr:phosphoribosylformylglycinamidine synthase subunit PurL [Rhodospirillales bacterium]MBT7779190.1 phosphoribosylformylglycinamidine synthase subunit PurL [Rhodospirillales bacterium]